MCHVLHLQCHKCGIELRDGLDLDLRVGLAMALRALIALLGLHLVDADLLAAPVLDDVGGDGGSLDNGGTEHGVILADDGENTVELDGGAGLGGRASRRR